MPVLEVGHSILELSPPQQLRLEEGEEVGACATK